MNITDLILESYKMIINDKEINLENQFDTFLNSINEPIVIMGQNFEPAEALKKLSPFQYEEKFKEWKAENRL